MTLTPNFFDKWVIPSLLLALGGLIAQLLISSAYGLIGGIIHSIIFIIVWSWILYRAWHTDFVYYRKEYYKNLETQDLIRKIDINPKTKELLTKQLSMKVRFMDIFRTEHNWFVWLVFFVIGSVSGIIVANILIGTDEPFLVKWVDTISNICMIPYLLIVLLSFTFNYKIKTVREQFKNHVDTERITHLITTHIQESLKSQSDEQQPNQQPTT